MSIDSPHPADREAALLETVGRAMVGVRDADGVYLIANSGLEQLYGAQRGELIGKSDSMFVGADCASRILARDRDVADSGNPMQSIDELQVGGEKRVLACLRFPVAHPTCRDPCTGFVAFELREGTTPAFDAARGRDAYVETLLGTIEQMRQRLATDELTGCWTRTRLAETGEHEASRRTRYGHSVSLVFVDLDRFKQVNDKHGHTNGDRVLREFCQLIRGMTRATDMIGRWGGEEFVIVLPHTGLATARLLAEKVRAAVESHDFSLERPVTASFGVAQCGDGEPWESWLARADAAMYRAKRAGRNRVVVDAPTDQGGSVVDSVGAGFLNLVWRKTFESGHALIDAQHQTLFASASELLLAATSDTPRARMLALLGALVKDCAHHFDTEERVLEELEFSDLQRHQRLHRRLLRKASELQAQCNAADLPLEHVLPFIVGDLIGGHVLGADRSYFPALAVREDSADVFDDDRASPIVPAAGEPSPQGRTRR